MKARAWLSMFLILIISYTGFGLTTSDLTKNSTAVTFDSDVVGVDVVTAIVVVNRFEFNVNEIDNYVFSNLQVLDSELLQIKEKFYEPIKELVLVPPLKNLQSDFKIYKFPDLKSKNYLLNYRRARDGISHNS